MAWRTVVVSNPARLRVERDQLLVEQGGDPAPLPLEDVAALILESPQITLSAALLARLARHDVTLIACDERHLPALATMPLAGHSRLAGVQRLQLGLSLPFRKRCWQAVVRAKIANQAACLETLGRPAADLRRLSGEVASGDSRNVEAQAAREYFRRVFGPGFSRGPGDDALNSALDYGYAVLRAAVARALAGHGFILAQGIHHHSELNPANLADDFLEPFRPVVDLFAAGLPAAAELGRPERQALASLLYAQVSIAGKRQPVLYAAELMAASFHTACERSDPSRLQLPELLPFTLHQYG